MQIKKILILIGICSALFITGVASGESAQPAVHNIKTVNRAFGPGEKLTYEISWSKVLDAGVAVMEVKDGKTKEGGRTFQFITTTRSSGLVETFYKVRDVVTSEVDADDFYSISFLLTESHGGRKRQRAMIFDHRSNKVTDRLNQDPPETFSVPERVLDALSSLYYLRTRQDFSTEKLIIVDVHDSGKNWAVEIQTLGKEKISTPAGEFNTIKVKTYPKYEGVFTHKGEIYIWLTDDACKMPVLMKSIISIGSIVATLTEFKTGEVKP